MKNNFLKGVWFLVIFAACLGSFRLYASPYYIDDKISADPSDEEAVCDYLKEKIDIFVTLNSSVTEEFSKISDKQLCNSVGAQCEYFYNKAIEYQKLYKKKCDDGFQAIAVNKCNYAANQCAKPVPTAAHPVYHANSRW